APPDSTRLRVWNPPRLKRVMRCLALARKAKTTTKRWTPFRKKLKPRAKGWKALALSIVPRPAPPAISRRSVLTGEAIVAADAVRDDVPCGDAAITSRGGCRRSAIC